MVAHTGYLIFARSVIMTTPVAEFEAESDLEVPVDEVESE
jgi:hypothetical protein